MKIIFAATFTLATLLAGCAVTPKDLALIRSGETKCLEQEATSGANKYLTRWCTSRQLFQPNRHVIKINDQVLFDGDDRDDLKTEGVSILFG